MTTELVSVDPEADLLEIQEKIIDNKQRILPVIERSPECRRDYPHRPFENFGTTVQAYQGGTCPIRSHVQVHARTRASLNFMQERLSPGIMEKLRTIGEVAR